MFTQGWRGGAAALGERVRSAFPRERERLNALFEPGRRREGLEVARPASARPGEGTLLSRVALAAPPRRQTVAAMIPPARAASRRAAWGRRRSRSWRSRQARAVSWSCAGARPNRSATVTTAAPPPAPTPPRPIAAPPRPEPAARSRRRRALAPSRPRRALRRPRRARAPTGTLSVNASPWGTVYVNGRLAGTTPLLRFPVRAGRAQVAIENPKLGRKVVDVRIEPKQDTPLIVDLRPPPETK